MRNNIKTVDKRKAFLFLIFLLITITAYFKIFFSLYTLQGLGKEGWLYKILEFLPVEIIWMNLSLPVLIIFSGSPSLIIGSFIFATLLGFPMVIIIILNICYLYIIAKLLIICFDKYRDRFSKWHWLVINVYPSSLERFFNSFSFC